MMTCLAIFAMLMQGLDLTSGIRMMLVYGAGLEQNPIARTIFEQGGPIGLTFMKVTVVLLGVGVLLLVGRAGRQLLARNSLIVVALLGCLGFASNLV